MSCHRCRPHWTRRHPTLAVAIGFIIMCVLCAGCVLG